MNFDDVWKHVEAYEGNDAKKISLNGLRVQFYMGAMEIPLVAFSCSKPRALDEKEIKAFAARLNSFGLVVDCVEEGANYKLNTKDENLYVGRMTPEALKLHARRIREIGKDAFFLIADFYATGEWHE